MDCQITDRLSEESNTLEMLLELYPKDYQNILPGATHKQWKNENNKTDNSNMKNRGSDKVLVELPGKVN